MLTEKECREALDGLRNLERYENLKKWNQVAPQVKADVIERLIKEHFSNPPLAWEEIEEGDFVWDKHFTVIGGEWLKVYEKRITEYGEKVLVCGACGCGVVQTRSYVEDRFYRKEVHG